MLLTFLLFKVFITLEALHVANKPGWAPSELFIFDLTIECHQNRKLDYYLDVQFLEYDYATNDDRIHEFHSEVARVGKIKRRIAAKMDGDEWFSENYKFLAVLNHECTSSGERVSLELELMQQCKVGGICHFAYDIDLTDQAGHLRVTDAMVQ